MTVVHAERRSGTHGRFDPKSLITHTFPLDRIEEAYRLFGERRDGVLKVALRP